MEPNEPNILQIASLIVERLKPELYEDMEYVCAIPSALHRLPNDNPKFAHFPDLIEQDAEFVKQVTIAAVEQIVRLPGIKTYFIGMIMLAARVATILMKILMMEYLGIGIRLPGCPQTRLSR